MLRLTFHWTKNICNNSEFLLAQISIKNLFLTIKLEDLYALLSPGALISLDNDNHDVKFMLVSKFIKGGTDRYRQWKGYNKYNRNLTG